MQARGKEREEVVQAQEKYTPLQAAPSSIQYRIYVTSSPRPFLTHSSNFRIDYTEFTSPPSYSPLFSMMSLRSLCRVVPRTSLRMTNYASRVVVRSSIPSAITVRNTAQLPRSFASTSMRKDQYAQELAAKLQSELDIEASETTGDNLGNIQAFKDANPDWTIQDQDGEQEVFLQRTYEDEEITVSFSIADFNAAPFGDEQDGALEDDMEDMDTQSGGATSKGATHQGLTGDGNVKVNPGQHAAGAAQEELRDVEDEVEEDQGDETFAANVNVLIQRKAKGALRIQLIADSGSLSIQSVAHIPDNKATASSTPAQLLLEPFDTLYGGPPFQSLDEDLQTLLETYLDNRGINTSMALFIPEYIDMKEQKEYLGWLNRVKEFVE